MKKSIFLLLLLVCGCAKKPAFHPVQTYAQSPGAALNNQNGKQNKASAMDTLYLVILKRNLKIKTLENVEEANELRLKLGLFGSMDNLAAFVADLESVDKFIQIRSLELSHDSKLGEPSQFLLETEIEVNPLLAQDESVLKLFNSSQMTQKNPTPVQVAKISKPSKAIAKLPRLPFPILPSNPGGLPGRGGSMSTNSSSSLEFLGTVRDGFSIQAVVGLNDEYRLVNRGDQVDGYLILDIQPERLTASGPSGTETFTLEEKSQSRSLGIGPSEGVNQPRELYYQRQQEQSPLPPPPPPPPPLPEY